MITKQTDSVAWALLVYELEDAQDGLKKLMQEMTEGNEFDEVAFQIHMAHIYAHLNRAWNGRNVVLPKSWTVKAGYLSQRHESQTYPPSLYGRVQS